MNVTDDTVQGLWQLSVWHLMYAISTLFRVLACSL